MAKKADKNIQPQGMTFGVQSDVMVGPAQGVPDSPMVAPTQESKPKSRKGLVLGIVIGVVVVLAFVIVFVMIRRANNSAASTYETAQVTRGSIEKIISGSGQLQASTTSEVGAQVSGTVTDLSVKLGSTVTTGTVLFTVDDDGALADAVTSASDQLESAQLSLTSAQQSLKSAQATQVTTAQGLLDAAKAQTDTSTDNSTGDALSGTGGAGSSSTKGGGSNSNSTISSTLTPAQAQTQADQANAQRAAQIASAQAQVKQAQSSVRSAQSSYNAAVKAEGETNVTAPSSGVVTALNVANGDTVSGTSSSSNNNSSNNNSNYSNNNSSLLSSLTGNNNNSSNNNSSSSSSAVEISDYTTAMTADLDVSESNISSVQTGQSVGLTFTAFPSINATGVVTQIAPTGTSSGSLVDFTVQVTLTAPDSQLRPGMSVTAEVITASVQNVLMVPNTAITEDSNGQDSVRVAVGGDTTNLKTVNVTVGIANDSYTEIKSGLSEGDVVISGTTTASSTGSSNSGGLFGGMGGGGGGTYRMANGGGGGGTYRNYNGGGGQSFQNPQRMTGGN